MKTMSKSRIIGFAGRKRSGKGTLCKGIKDFYEPKTITVTIADSLKYLCCDLLGLSYRDLNKMKDDGTVFNTVADERWVDIISRATNIEKSVVYQEINGRKFTDVREVLQVVGTDLIRKYVPSWHIDKAIERVLSYGDDKVIVLDDVRFPNEKKMIEEIGGDVFFVIRPNCWDVSNHPSETALQYTDFEANRVIINDTDEEHLYKVFCAYYFSNGIIKDTESPILLSANPWYLQHVMDTETNTEVFNSARQSIIKLVLEQNKHSHLFKTRGVITFASDDVTSLLRFRRLILNQEGGGGYTAYSVYNPLTNEILKKYIES